jgi:hypothetical protein
VFFQGRLVAGHRIVNATNAGSIPALGAIRTLIHMVLEVVGVLVESIGFFDWVEVG